MRIVWFFMVLCFAFGSWFATKANFLERALIAPYFVNYHLEHHLLVSCPCYRLPKAHALLIRKGFGPRMETKPNYLAMLRHAVSKPETVAA